MSVFRLHKNGNYTHMSTYHLRDTRLTWQSKGMLSFMYSNTETFEYSIEGLVKCADNGETSVKSILKELKQYGYLKVYAVRNNKGQVVDWQYDIYEKPESENPDAENPDVENPQVENQGQSNINNKVCSNSNTPDSRITTEHIIIEDKNNNKERKKKEIGFDLSFVPPQMSDAWNEWLAFRKELEQADSKKAYYKTQRGMETQFSRLRELSNGDVLTAKKIIQQSIANEWLGFFPLKQNGTISNSAEGYGVNNASETYRAISAECGRVLNELFSQDKHA